MGSETTLRVLDGGLNLGLAIAGLVIITRLIVGIQFKLVQTTFERNHTLEERVDRVEKRNEELEDKLDAEQDEHRSCRALLAEHKIEAAAQLAAHKVEAAAQLARLSAQVEMLTNQMNRARRCTDDPEPTTIQGEVTVHVDPKDQ